MKTWTKTWMLVAAMALPVNLLAVNAIAGEAPEAPLKHTLVVNVEGGVDRLMGTARALEGSEGVEDVKIDLGRSRVTARFAAEKANLDSLVASMESKGIRGRWIRSTKTGAATVASASSTP